MTRKRYNIMFVSIISLVLILAWGISKISTPANQYQIILHENPDDSDQYILIMDGDRTVTKLTPEQDKVLDSVITNDNQ